MIKIGHHKDFLQLSLELPTEVNHIVDTILMTLDDAYGENRHIDKELGGYVLILTTIEDFNELSHLNLEKDNLISEYVDKVAVNGGEDWSNSLILMSSDFSVSLIMPVSILPDCLRKHLI